MPPTIPPPWLTFEKYAHSLNGMYHECGLTDMNGYQYQRSVTSRIVGGRQAVPHSHPWQVLLNNRGKFCGGELVVDSR